MDVFTLAAKLTLDTGEFSTDLANAEAQAKGFGKSKVWSTIGKVAAGATVAAGTAVVKAIKSSVETGMQFDAMMSEVQAVSQATGNEFDILRARAQELGATTKFTATEAAEAFYYMGLAGWDVEEMLDGIGPVLSLAAASGEDLGRTSDIVTDALTALGYEAKDAAEFADVLAAAATNSNTTVGMMGEAFKYLATTGGVLGYSMEDVAVTLGLLANSCIKAGQAGTSTRQILNTLIAPTDKAAAAMEELGIYLFEQGTDKRIPLIDVLKNIRDTFQSAEFDLAGKSLEDVEETIAEIDKEYADIFAFFDENPDGKLPAVRADGKNVNWDYGDALEAYGTQVREATGFNEEFLASISAIGGLRGIGSLFAIMKSTDDDFDQLVSSVYNSEGTAQEMAETMLDNLQGDITILNSAFDGLKLVVSDQFSPAFREAVQTITGGISEITQSIRDNGLAQGIWSWLIGEGELDQIDRRLDNDMNAAEVNAFRAEGLIAYMQTLIEQYGEAATNTTEWKTAVEELEGVMPGVGEQLTEQGNTLQENLDKVIAMKDEMRNMAIQQAVAKAAQDQMDYLAEQQIKKVNAEIQRGEAEAALGVKDAQMVEMIRAYAAEELRLAQGYNADLEAHGITDLGVSQERLSELQQTAEEFTAEGKTSLELMQMAQEALYNLGLAYSSYDPDNENYIWNSLATDNLLSPEQFDAIGDQMDQYEKQLQQANEDIDAANKEIEATNEQLRITQEAARRINEALYGSGANIDAAGTDAASNITSAGQELAGAMSAAAASLGAGDNAAPHAKGAWNVPYDDYPALLHRGEMVLTSSQARRYREGQGGMMDFSGFLSGIRQEIKAGLESANIRTYLDGYEVTEQVNRRQAADYTARRYTPA